MTTDLTAALERARCALAILEEQAAGYTALTIPANLQIDLEAKRREVAELEARIGRRREPVAASPPSPAAESPAPATGDESLDWRWLALGCAVATVLLFMFKHSWRCLLNNRLTEAVLGLLVILVPVIVTPFAKVIKPAVRFILWSFVLGVALATVVGIVAALFLPPLSVEDCWPTITPTVTETPTSTLTLVPTSTATSTATPMPCPYQGVDDHQTILNLIRAEALAVSMRDADIIRAIFAADAVFHDYASEPPPQWRGPQARYMDDLFVNTALRNVGHFDISPVGRGLQDRLATYTSGSRGEYRTGDVWIAYENGSLGTTAYGSDHWTLMKEAGCWVIVQLDFNAGHVPFP